MRVERKEEAWDRPERVFNDYSRWTVDLQCPGESGRWCKAEGGDLSESLLL